ncbi:hypothetical protein HOV35_gp61 [Escherichia phage Sortsne]|uniref:Uncharacterized protein n=1 Tax=Escherichia phage Sortsne TaxID=2562456 RepID=A0A4D6E0M0_9CAUD|nr:hypothetical protein HOV35_gp61 [Escherichia phage Sortsne]QBZ71626.1 hypothetical protein [Escherichia phage Sortsne]
MKEQQEKKAADVVDLSHMYVGPQQRATLFQSAYDRYRKKGFSHNQATGLATQAVEGFVAQMDQKRREAVEESKRQDKEADL